MLCSAEWNEAITMLFVMQIPRENNLQYFILFSNALELFIQEGLFNTSLIRYVYKGKSF